VRSADPLLSVRESFRRDILSKTKNLLDDIREQLAIEFFAGFDDFDELFDRVATQMKVDRSTVETLYNEMNPSDNTPI